MLKIPVTNYVFRFLAKEFGTGPYLLDFSDTNRLRLEFLSTHLHVSLYKSLLPQQYINIRIQKSKTLCQYYQANHQLFENAIFGANLFWLSFRTEIATSMNLSQKYETRLSTKEAILMFMDRIGLTEDEYSLDNFMRQYTRQKTYSKIYQTRTPLLKIRCS